MAGRLRALLFDCDGVIAETERDGHRAAFNRAFKARGLAIEWSEARYGELLATGGGKERLRRHFDETAWPVPEPGRDDFIKDLHALKTDLFAELILAGGIPPRPGVLRLMDEALAAGVRLAVCSTADERAVRTVIQVLLGPERGDRIAVFAGDVVAAKKPDPAVYRLAVESLGLDGADCVVIEDSAIGLRAALDAGIACVVTPSGYTRNEDFTGAALVVDGLDGGENAVTLARLEAVLSGG